MKLSRASSIACPALTNSVMGIAWNMLGPSRDYAPFPTRITRYLSSAYIRYIGDLACHITIRGYRDVKKKVSQNVVSASLTDKSEIKREGIFQGSTTTHMEALMVGLRPHVLDTTCLSHSSSSKYVVEMKVETATGINGLVYRGFNTYNSGYDLPRTIIEEAKGEGI